MNLDHGVDLDAPRVELSRIKSIPTVEVTVHELKELRHSSVFSSAAFALFSMFFGMLIPTLISWCTTSSPTTLQTAIYLAAAISLAGLSLVSLLVFGFTAKRAKSKYDEMISHLRAAS